MRRLKRSTAKFYRCLLIDGYGGAVEGAHKIQDSQIQELAAKSFIFFNNSLWNCIFWTFPFFI